MVNGPGPYGPEPYGPGPYYWVKIAQKLEDRPPSDTPTHSSVRNQRDNLSNKALSHLLVTH